MKLIIKQKGKIGIRLWFPTRMIFSRTAFRLFRRSLATARDMAEDESPEPEALEKTIDYREVLNRDGNEQEQDDSLGITSPRGSGETVRKEVGETVRNGIRSEAMGWEKETRDNRRECYKKSFDFEEFMTSLSDEKIDELMNLFRRMKKDHPGVPLVDVRSAEGDRVLIQL